ncbi:hypothetical protein AgCh_036641 [Apium graveolens]
MDSLKNKRKMKDRNIEIIPENAPYLDDSHITVGRFADESSFDEYVEQNELSKLSAKRKRGVQDVAAKNMNTKESQNGRERDGFEKRTSSEATQISGSDNNNMFIDDMETPAGYEYPLKASLSSVDNLFSHPMISTYEYPLKLQHISVDQLIR